MMDNDLKEFWEWCGLDIETTAKKEYANSVQAQTGKGYGGWETWEKDCEDWRKDLFLKSACPELTLDNLFKYAVPKLRKSWDINLYCSPHFPNMYHAKIEDSLNGHPQYIVGDRDPAVALLDTINKVRS